MKRLLREPLVWFVVLGGLLFGLDAIRGERRVEAGRGDIIVPEGRIESLAALFAKTWQRPPTLQELRGLIDDYVLEEAMYREAMTLGLDRDDTIVRRRMRQKMEFVVNDITEQAEPSEAELEKWLAEHPESYALPDQLSFRHVFVNAGRRGETAQRDARELLSQLRSGAADLREVGDASLLPPGYADTASDTIGRTFGEAFAAKLGELPDGEWSGPVESPFGLHLVIIDARTRGRVPALAEVHAAVERDVMYARREAASKRFHEELVARFNVTVEWPKSAEGNSGSDDEERPSGRRQ